MKLIIAFVLAITTVTACASNPPPKPVVIAANCASDAGRQVGQDVVDRVATALASEQYVPALEKLGVDFGEAFITCLVNYVRTEALGRVQGIPTGASADPIEVTKVKHADVWLRAHPL